MANPKFAAAMAALAEEVGRNTTVDGSAKALITILVNQVEANKADPVALQALVDTIRASTDDLAASVITGTPVEVDPTDPAAAARR